MKNLISVSLARPDFIKFWNGSCATARAQNSSTEDSQRSPIASAGLSEHDGISLLRRTVRLDTALNVLVVSVQNEFFCQYLASTATDGRERCSGESLLTLQKDGTRLIGGDNESRGNSQFGRVLGIQSWLAECAPRRKGEQRVVRIRG